jgi:histidinol dehydrogenase
MMDLASYRWQDLDQAMQTEVLERPALRASSTVLAETSRIVDQVRRQGDRAIRELSERYDGIKPDTFEVSADEFDAAAGTIPKAASDAIDLAIQNVSRFHEAQTPLTIDIETMPGVRCQRISQPIDSIGLYIPAGSAPLPSTAIMLTVPARIAACPERILCTPPRKDGSADPGVLVAARRGGASRVFKIGGAQAIAAMAYGTDEVPKVNKIFGPGNAWVTAAKTIVAGDPAGAAIDLPAGPSEVMVIADQAADAGFVAADLLSQAEHGEDSQSILLSTSRELIDEVQRQLIDQSGHLGRQEIVRQAMRNSCAILVNGIDEAIRICNHYAPEHLILQIADPRRALQDVRNAGSVFLGPWAPESVGDYCSGTNHVLPTYGTARAYSGLGLDQFLRHMTVQELTRDGLAALSDTVINLAGLEGLDAHANAVMRRLEETEQEAQAS